MFPPELVLHYWHLGLAGIAVLFSLRSSVNFSAALIYFSILAAFYLFKLPADYYGDYYYLMCAAVEASIFIALLGYKDRLARYLRITSVSAMIVQLSVFAAYHVSWLKWTYGIYQAPLIVIEVSQCLAIIALSGPVLIWSARRSRAEPGSKGGTWLAKTILKHS